MFFSGRVEPTPPSLQQLVRHTGVLYERVILVTVVIEPMPTISMDERIKLESYDEGFYRIMLRYGFMHTPNIPSDLSACADLGLHLDLDEIHYIVGHLDLLAGRKLQGMAAWRDKLFAFLARNTQNVIAGYHIPAAQMMTVGLHVGI